MDNTPQQPDAEDRYEAVLREHHKAARRLDSDLKDLAEYLRGNLPEVARHLLTAIPQQSEAWRQELGLAIRRGPRASGRPGERRPQETRASEESTAWVMERGVGSRQLTKGTNSLERTAVQKEEVWSREEGTCRGESVWAAGPKAGSLAAGAAYLSDHATCCVEGFGYRSVRWPFGPLPTHKD